MWLLFDVLDLDAGGSADLLRAHTMRSRSGSANPE